jgi:hypothetical protein
MPDYRSLFRQQVFAGVEDWREDFNATQPNEHDQIRQSYRARPASFHPPLVYLGPVSEALSHSASTKGDILTGSVVVVRGLYDNEEAVDWRDAAVWSLHEYLTVNKNLVSTKTLTEDVELDMGSGTVYIGGLVNVRLDIRFGRD